MSKLHYYKCARFLSFISLSTFLFIISTPIRRFSPWFHFFPSLIPHIPTLIPHHFHHSPHSVPKLPILVFTDSPTDLGLFNILIIALWSLQIVHCRPNKYNLFLSQPYTVSVCARELYAIILSSFWPGVFWIRTADISIGLASVISIFSFWLNQSMLYKCHYRERFSSFQKLFRAFPSKDMVLLSLKVHAVERSIYWNR